jgi:hypothetical protein
MDMREVCLIYEIKTSEELFAIPIELLCIGNRSAVRGVLISKIT